MLEEQYIETVPREHTVNVEYSRQKSPIDFYVIHGWCPQEKGPQSFMLEMGFGRYGEVLVF